MTFYVCLLSSLAASTSEHNYMYIIYKHYLNSTRSGYAPSTIYSVYKIICILHLEFCYQRNLDECLIVRPMIIISLISHIETD